MEDLAEPEVPSRIQVPATTVTKENVDSVMDLGILAESPPAGRFPRRPAAWWLRRPQET